jgi:DTW domain-containing protein YfiP
MHARELEQASSTAHLVSLTLAQGRVHVRGSIKTVFKGEAVLLADRQPVFLFPGPKAVPLTAAWARERKEVDPRPFQLIVPDGSWSQVKNVQERERAFWRVPCVSLSGIPSRYQLRRSPHAGGLATFEAIAHALRFLEGDAVADALLDVFGIMVEQNLKARGRIPHERDACGPRALLTA